MNCGVGKRRNGAIEHGFADRRRPVDDLPDARRVVTAEGGMIGQDLDHRRHQQNVGDTLVLECRHHAFRRKAGDDHVGAAAQQDRIHRSAVGEMKHRRGVKIDRRSREQPLGQRVHGIGHQVAVAEHHALRPAGGAAGVENAGEIGAIAHRVRYRIASAAAGLRNPACRPVPRRRRRTPASARQSSSPMRPRSARTPCRPAAPWPGSRASHPRFRAGSSGC